MNGFTFDSKITLRDVVWTIIFIASLIAFASRGESHISNNQIHLSSTEKVLVDKLEKDDILKWKSDVNSELKSRDLKVREIVRETVKELKEEGYLK